MITGTELALAGLAALAAGAINALAGGGTLISFPALVAMGIPPVTANVTNTVALCPGYLGGALAQRGNLAGQGRRLRVLLPVGIAGGITGGILLVVVSEQIFHFLVPFLILFASLLLAVQDRIRDRILRMAHRELSTPDEVKRAVIPTGLASVYGGYFGAGQSVITLSVLGLFLDDTLTRLNALKQCIALSSNCAAAIYFLFSGMILWPVAGCMAVGALAGGAAGGRFAARINPVLLRWTIVSFGTGIGIILLAQG
jgi:uncharacterized membrane protein YfcA